MSYAQDARLEMTLVEALRTLGSTTDEVAETLRGKGIKGRSGSPCGCPVTRYLVDIFAGYYVETYSTAASLRFDGATGDVAAYVDLPGPVVWFIDAFDDPNGPYGDLREPPSRPAVSIVDDPNEIVSRTEIAREHGAPWLS